MRLSISAVKTTAVFFWLWVGVIYFWNLGSGSLEFWDESLSAERAREFFLTGDWLTPHSSLEPVFNKPPVYYWLTALNFAILGENEFTVRLGSVLFGIGCLIFACLIGRGASGSQWGGLLAAFFLATNPHWINYTRNGMLDSGLMFGILAGIYFLIYGRSLAGVVLSGVAFALGCLIKNPLALVGLLVPAVELGFVRKSGPWFHRVLISGAISCLLSLCWYGFQYLKWGGAYLDQFVGYNMLARFSRPIEGHEAGPFFYLETWWGGSGVSLALFVLPIIYFFLRDRSVLRHSLAWLAILLVFLVLLSGSASKRGFYLLLIYPFAAIVSGSLWWFYSRFHVAARRKNVSRDISDPCARCIPGGSLQALHRWLPEPQGAGAAIASRGGCGCRSIQLWDSFGASHVLQPCIDACRMAGTIERQSATHTA